MESTSPRTLLETGKQRFKPNPLDIDNPKKKADTSATGDIQNLPVEDPTSTRKGVWWMVAIIIIILIVAVAILLLKVFHIQIHTSSK